MDDRNYWNKFYKENRDVNLQSSSFAEFSEFWIASRKELIEFGCGNGRDSIYFSSRGLDVTAVDNSQETIDSLNEGTTGVNAICKDVADVHDITGNYDVVYSRFFLHSIDEHREDVLLSWAAENLRKDGIILIEVRTNKDENLKKTYEGHFRRYVDFEVLKEKISNLGFSIDYAIESQGLSVYGNEDPYLARIVARRQCGL
jgi:cyclopropane fatty-acyl-phospholipid synthase-like methyltransferase